MCKTLKYLLPLGLWLNLTFISAGEPPSTNWALVMNDEFSGSSLDTTKWSTTCGYPVSGGFAFNPTNIVVSEGSLKLVANKETLHGKSYTAAFLESRFNDPGNGSYLEVQAKMMDARANVCCAIWEQTFPLLRSLNPNPEIDIVEYMLGSNASPKMVRTTLHRWPIKAGPHTEDAHTIFYGPAPLCDAFHTYGLERSDGKLRFYLDGSKYWEADVNSMPEDVTMPRHLIFSVEGHAGKPVDAYLPAIFEIDYVRIYKHRDTSPASGSR